MELRVYGPRCDGPARAAIGDEPHQAGAGNARDDGEEDAEEGEVKLLAIGFWLLASVADDLGENLNGSSCHKCIHSSDPIRF